MNRDLCQRLLATTLLAGVLTAPASAQDVAAEQAITVTGSRIKRPNFETLYPAIVLDDEQIEERGFETLGQAINELPAFGVPGSSAAGAAQSGAFSGQSFVNFLGLGDQRTLVLVNGRRFVSSNTASIFGPTDPGLQVDLNTINTKLIERVETIAIGGAPIYGSDAIAGTVNVILKRDFAGIDLDAQYGVASRGDARNYRLRGLAGHNFADGRGNVTIAAEYNRGKGLLFNDRAITRRGLFGGDCPPGSANVRCVFENQRIPSISEGGTPTVGSEIAGLNLLLSPEQMAFFTGLPPFFSFGVQDATGNPLFFDQSGNLTPVDFGQIVSPTDFNFSGGSGFNIANTLQLLAETRRYNANLLTHYELSDTVRLFAEGWYSRAQAVNLRGSPSFNSGRFPASDANGPIIVSINNLFLTPEQRAVIQTAIATNPLSERNIMCTFMGLPPGPMCGPPQDFFYLQRANTDITSGRASSTTNVYRLVGGLDGTAEIAGRALNWEVVANFGRSATRGRRREIVQQNFLNAVDAVVDGSGNIVCRPGHVNAPVASVSAPCAPLNLFGSGAASQAAIDYVTAFAGPKGVNKQYVLTAAVNGPLMSLGAGDLAFALGVEHRKESSRFNPGAFLAGGDDPNPLVDSNGDGDPTNDRVPFGRVTPVAAVKGSYHTNEAFAELRAPLVGAANRLPGVYSLELHGAARLVDHSRAGADWTYTTEARWGIVRDLAVRGNFTHAIRAPAITELFHPTSTAFGTAVDPCDQDELANGPDPAVRAANCAAAGLVGFDSFSSSLTFPQGIGGNRDLDNERSNAWSVGAVLSPRAVPGLTISADYLDIRLKDAITLLTASQVLNACYDSPDFPDAAACDQISRIPTAAPPPFGGQLAFVGSRYVNAAELRYRGILASLAYQRPTPFLGGDSRVGIHVSYQYLRTLTRKVDGDSARIVLDGATGYPHHSGVLTLNYRNGPFGWFGSFHYTGKTKLDPNAADDFYQVPGRDDVLFVNSGISFAIADRMTFRLSVDNVFDTDAPFPGILQAPNAPSGAAVNSYWPGFMGRYFRAGASVRF